MKYNYLGDTFVRALSDTLTLNSFTEDLRGCISYSNAVVFKLLLLYLANRCFCLNSG